MIENTLLYFKTKTAFNTQLEADNIKNDSITFIQDTRQICTHGTYFDCDNSAGNIKVSDELAASAGVTNKNVEAMLSALVVGYNWFYETALPSKQDNITDLDNIRSGASLGATAVQPSQLSIVAISGSYNDLSNKPTIPDSLSDLTEDTAHRTVTDTEKTTWNAKSDFSGSYNDLSNKPTIPSAITVDSSLSSTSTNPVQNKVINSALSGKLSTSGTAAAATKLANKRTIWGQEFDGTGNITGDITTSGNVKIANAKGISGANSAGTYTMAFQPRNASNETLITYGAGGFILRNESSSAVFAVNSSRNVGIRTSPSSSYNVYIAGSVYTNNQLTVEGALTAKASLTAKSTFGVVGTSQFEKDVTMFAGLKFYSGGVIYGYGSNGSYQSCFQPRTNDITYLNYGAKGFKLRNNSSTEIMVIDTNDATTFKKDVTVSGTFSNPSSLVLKNVLNRDCLTLEQLSSIKPARFTWKDERDTDVHIGGIADEVKAVIPEVVHEQEDGTFTMEYANAAFAMVASLVKHVEQNQKRIAELEKELEVLKNRLEYVEGSYLRTLDNQFNQHVDASCHQSDGYPDPLTLEL